MYSKRKKRVSANQYHDSSSVVSTLISCVLCVSAMSPCPKFAPDL